MKEIEQVKSISIWVFLVPFVALNLCLLLITQFHSLFPNQEHILHNTFPYIDVRNPTFTQEHEASTSNVSEDQLFYCQQRGLSTEDAIHLIVGGFCNDVFNKLPMEFAIEANQLLAVSLEGTVG